MSIPLKQNHLYQCPRCYQHLFTTQTILCSQMLSSTHGQAHPAIQAHSATILSSSLCSACFSRCYQRLPFLSKTCIFFLLLLFLCKFKLSTSLLQCAYYTKAFHLSLPEMQSASDTKPLQHLCFIKRDFTDHELS